MANLNNIIDYTSEKLNERVTIRRPSYTVDSEGNRICQYRDYKTVWANVSPVGTVTNGETSAEVRRVVNYSIVVRSQHDLVHYDDVIVWHGVTMKQTSPSVDIGCKFTVISCKDMRENG